MSLQNLLLGGILYSSALNNARTAQIQNALAQQNQVIAENHRLTQAAQAEQDRINQLRQTVFNLKKGIEFLFEMASVDPIAAYLNVLAYDHLIASMGIHPNSFSEFADKEYTLGMINAKFSIMAELEQNLEPHIVERVKRYHALRLTLPRFLEVNDWLEIMDKYPGPRPWLSWVVHPVAMLLWLAPAFAYAELNPYDSSVFSLWFVGAVIGGVWLFILKGIRQRRMEKLNTIAKRQGGWVSPKATKKALRKILDGMVQSLNDLAWDAKPDSEHTDKRIAAMEHEMASIEAEFQLTLTDPL